VLPKRQQASSPFGLAQAVAQQHACRRVATTWVPRLHRVHAPPLASARHHLALSPRLAYSRHCCHKPSTAALALRSSLCTSQPAPCAADLSLPLLCSLFPLSPSRSLFSFLRSLCDRAVEDWGRTDGQWDPKLDATSFSPAGERHVTPWGPRGSHYTPLPSLTFLCGLGPRWLQKQESWSMDRCIAQS
jgi:hypothetical protein